VSTAARYLVLHFAGAWGYRDDGDAGLLHVGARYYDPQVDRFISRDAVLSEHPYLYCGHESANRVDPSGDDWFDDLTNLQVVLAQVLSNASTICFGR
jgi:RHS repeat-associated protein